MENQSSNWIFLVFAVLAIVWFCKFSKEKYTNYPRGGFPSPLLYDHYTKNQNAFGNYYRVGYESSQDMGWKPEMNWDHLRPEMNECPLCYPDELDTTMVATKDTLGHTAGRPIAFSANVTNSREEEEA